MSTTLITNQAQLQAWANSPTGTGQLQNDITIDVVTWTAPSNNITAGVVFDGNGKTVTLLNTSGTDRGFSGLVRLSGGTVQNVKITSNSTDTPGQYISPTIYSSYLLYESSSGSLKTGTINGVWIDACKANGMFNFNNVGSAGFLCGTNCNYTITNCQVGRSKDNPAYTSASMGTFLGIVCGGNGQSPQVSKSVFFFETHASGNYSTIFYGACGLSVGYNAPTCTISECVFYWKNSISPTTSTLYGDQATRGRNTCAVARGPNRISIDNCYLFIDWNVTISDAKYSLMFGNSLNGSDTLTVGNVSNIYVLLNFVNGNSIVAGNEPVFWATSVAHSMTNIAIPPNTTFDISNGTRTNCMNTYSTSTLNTDATIAAFSNTVWNKTVAPPLLSFNSTTPWDSTNAVYDSPNVLTTFVDGGGGGGGGDEGGVICYGRGTRILMDDGTEKAVEHIQAGDLVQTYKHGPKQVTLSYASDFYNEPKKWYRCMFENQESGLRITGSHRILVRDLADWQWKTYETTGLPLQRLDDDLILLHSTVACDKFKPVRSSNKFDIFHFALSDDPDEIFGVYANGILTESVPKKLIEQEQKLEEVTTVPVEAERVSA